MQNGKESVELAVRAASKPGAVMTARVEAVGTIPFRSQKVVKAQSEDNSRFLNKWSVVVVDTKQAKDVI